VLLLLLAELGHLLLLAQSSQLLLRQATHDRVSWPLLLLDRPHLLLLLLRACAQCRGLLPCQSLVVLCPRQLLLALCHRFREVMQLQAQRQPWDVLQGGRNAGHQHTSITLSP
jgi:hypothetical protein